MAVAAALADLRRAGKMVPRPNRRPVAACGAVITADACIPAVLRRKAESRQLQGSICA